MTQILTWMWETCKLLCSCHGPSPSVKDVDKQSMQDLYNETSGRQAQWFLILLDRMEKNSPESRIQ